MYNIPCPSPDWLSAYYKDDTYTIGRPTSSRSHCSFSSSPALYISRRKLEYSEKSKCASVSAFVPNHSVQQYQICDSFCLLHPVTHPITVQTVQVLPTVEQKFLPTKLWQHVSRLILAGQVSHAHVVEQSCTCGSKQESPLVIFNCTGATRFPVIYSHHSQRLAD